MSDPTPQRFAALARSSPWRWRSLEFTFSQRRHGRGTALRALVQRPDRLRIEDLDGTLVSDLRQQPWPGTVLTSAGGPVGRPEMFGPLDPRAPRPELDPDGLVVARPQSWSLGYDDPMHEDYRWVAMLDPVELADGRDGDGNPVPEPPVLITDLRAVDHHGRPAWEAVLRPTDGYDPRCSCCPLLLSAESDRYETPSILESVPGLRFADAHLVRLDVGTGVCVHTAEIGGDRPGEGHELVIERVVAG